MRTAAVCAVTALVLSGCSNAVEGLAEGTVERAIENELGESADVSINDDSFTVDTEQGSITAGAGSVPEDFPADVPLADGEVSFSQRLDTADGLGWSVVITTSGDPAAIAEQLRSDLAGQGFSVDESSQLTQADASGATILAEKDGLNVLVLVSGDGSSTQVTYTVSEATTP